MNTSAIEATLQRLRALAGAEGVSSPAAYGWFGFLDVLGPPQERSSPERCSTPSTALSDLSESDSLYPKLSTGPCILDFGLYPTSLIIRTAATLQHIPNANCYYSPLDFLAAFTFLQLPAFIVFHCFQLLNHPFLSLSSPQYVGLSLNSSILS